MTLFQILYYLIIMPLRTVFEFLYSLSFMITDNLGVSIIILSVAINILVLPLYRRAEVVQEKERVIEAKLKDGVRHIKQTFTGDERMLILQTYYRQNNYKPTYALKGAISLLLEIPFFIAAYSFISGLQDLNGVSFLLIEDLGKPDEILTVFGIKINILPVLMTIINLISTFIYTRDCNRKTKIQLYGMAAIFLVLLYNSPSALTFYWTLNNTFSLVKTICSKSEKINNIVLNLISAAGVVIVFYEVWFCENQSITEKVICIIIGIGMVLPLFHKKYGKRLVAKSVERIPGKSNTKMFFSGAVFISILTGVLIPSAVISSSAQEFIVSENAINPLWYLVGSSCISFGTFVIWIGIFYMMLEEKYRVIFDFVIWVTCGITIINYMFFGKGFGVLNSTLQYENEMRYSLQQIIINLGTIAAVSLLLLIAAYFFKTHMLDILIIGVTAICVMSAVNIVEINKSLKEVNQSNTIATEDDNMESLFTLSKEGQNVIVVMMDRALGEYLPYIMKERPEIKEQFSGFTYYSNTISFGSGTNTGSPALYGGYEYTPIEMNRRSGETLEEKHNEALKVMPVLFDENDYDVTVCDPTYAGYQWVPDLSIYDDYPNIKTSITLGKYYSKYMTDSADHHTIERNLNNFFRYGLMMTSLELIRPILYNDGLYHCMDDTKWVQTIKNNYEATGFCFGFMCAFNVLYNLPSLTGITDETTNHFVMLANETSHEQCMLQLPEYTPSDSVDNRAYKDRIRNSHVINGKHLKMETEDQITQYQANASALIQMGNWFDYLKANGVYDNTRIILVADHGWGYDQLEDLILNEDGEKSVDLEYFYPLLMVKDFQAENFSESKKFMTNADVPYLATENVIDNPKNPFTGKEIDDSEKTKHDQYVLYTDKWKIEKNNGNTFLPGEWLSVNKNIWNKDNWKKIANNKVLQNYKPEN